MRSSSLSRLATVGLVAAVAVLAGCSEQLEGGNACPALCPVENVPVRDTVLTAVTLDSTLAGYPLAGEQPYVLMATAPGSPPIDVRMVARFDTVLQKYLPVGAVDSAAIASVDSGYLRLRLDSAGTRATSPVTLEAYDVDTAGVDSAVAGLAPLFRPDRLLGSLTVDPANLKDSVRVPISNAVLAAKFAAGRRVRIGVLARSSAPAELRMFGILGATPGTGPLLSFDPVPGNDYRPLTLETSSTTPPGDTGQAFAFRTFTLGVSVPRLPDGSDIVVGGLAGRRVYLRFDVPRSLLDSANVVRATLILDQIPTPGQLATDTVRVIPDVVAANRNVTSLRRAVTLTLPQSSLLSDTLELSPTTSGTKEVSVAGVISYWRLQSDSAYQALSLRAVVEGAQPSELRFHSREALPALRPRLRISYVPRTQIVLP